MSTNPTPVPPTQPPTEPKVPIWRTVAVHGPMWITAAAAVYSALSGK